MRRMSVVLALSAACGGSTVPLDATTDATVVARDVTADSNASDTTAAEPWLADEKGQPELRLEVQDLQHTTADDVTAPDLAPADTESLEAPHDSAPEAKPQPKGGPVALSGVVNAREAGGLPTSDGQHVRHMVLIRSGDLSGLDQTGCEQFAALGIRTIIDLRTQAEADSKPDAQCALSKASWHLAGLPKILPPSQESYLQTLDAACPALPVIFSKLVSGTPAIIHCVIGRDRAGIVMGLVLLALGVSGPDVVTDFVENQEFQVEAAWMQAVVDEVAKNGGIEAFLIGCGVNPNDVILLRTQVLE